MIGASAYVALTAERAPLLLAAVGGAAVSLLVLGLGTRWSPLVAAALIVFGGEYAVSLLLGEGAVDVGAPVIAAALFLAAELAYWSIERGVPAAPMRVGARRLVTVAALALVSLPVGVLVLGASGAQLQGGLVLEAVGVAAAAGAVAFVARLSARARAPADRR